MSRFGGAGFEAAGDPSGGGGALHVLRARAIEGQTVRVTLSGMPLHRSPAARNDALNSANWFFSVAAGQGTAPVCVGVKRALAVFPDVGVYNADEVAVDVQVDRPVVVSLTYKVEARNIFSFSGEPLGFPYSAEFPGAIRTKMLFPLKRDVGYADFDNSPFLGSFRVDSSGDIAFHTGSSSLRKRVYRRVITQKGSFSFLPDYGLSLNMKKPITIDFMQKFKADLNKQILQEPEVKSLTSQLQKDNRGFLIVSLNILTKQGEVVDFTLTANSNGAITVD